MRYGKRYSRILPLILHEKEAISVFNNATILITGGTGSWGTELVLQLLPFDPRKIIVFSRNEDRQVTMRREITDKRLTFHIGDIRDKEALLRVLHGVDFVFHLAALKHVPVCEEHPLEALKTNVNGTQNLIDAAITARVKKVIHVSTDKAVDPANFYGFTKAIGEKIVIDANENSVGTKFICVRSGNVLGTNGSVLHLFIDQIKQNKEVTITDKRMTRFFLTQADAIKLLLKAATDGDGGEIFVLNMPACKITDLAEVLIRYYGRNVKMTETGLRPGEKRFEVLLSDKEILLTVHYNQDYFVVLPSHAAAKHNPRYANCPLIRRASYRSDEELMSHTDILQLLSQSQLLG